MVENLLLLKNYFRKNNIFFRDDDFFSFPGSSEASVFLFKKNIYKIINKKESKKVAIIFKEFRNSLSSDFDLIFPPYKIVNKEKEYDIWEMEYSNERDLEKLIFGGLFSEKEIFPKIDSIIYERIDLMFQKTKKKINCGEKNKLIKDIFETIDVNFKKANIELGEWNKKKIKIYKNIINNESIGYLSLTHNDLSVGNILVNVAENPSVKFIDPRSSLPQHDITFFSGNVALDLVGYFVSIERKHLEVSNNDSLVAFEGSKNNFRKYVNIYRDNKIFSDIFLNIIFLAWYSSYLGCVCEYCLSEDRKYLYKEMERKALLIIKQL